MRLILLPLAPKRTLLYCQPLLAPLVRDKPRIDDRIVTKAAQTWRSFEASDTKWKQALVKFGQAAMERIPYEEWSLKTVPPLNMYKQKVKKQDVFVSPETVAEKNLDIEPVKVVYPASQMNYKQAIATLRSYADDGVAKHKKNMIWCAIILPLTAPVALLPVVPNVPGFYVTYRLWSNWKAWQGAKHLQTLLKTPQNIQGVTLPSLDYVYEPSRYDGRLDKQEIETIGKIFDSPGLVEELDRAEIQITRAEDKTKSEANGSEENASEAKEPSEAKAEPVREGRK